MMGIEGLGPLLVMLAFGWLGLAVLYAVIRVAVRDGMSDALRRQDARRVRSELRLGQERSPNQSG
jgi:hypothetical protein